jgi:hypothetical protein
MQILLGARVQGWRLGLRLDDQPDSALLFSRWKGRRAQQYSIEFAISREKIALFPGD